MLWVLIALSVVFIFLSGIPRGKSNAVMFHFDQTKWKDRPEIYNPFKSWVNKWKNGDSKQGERFWLSSTLLVGFTDAWHKWEEYHRFALAVGFTILGLIAGLYSLWFLFGIVPLYLLFAMSFHIFYNKYKNK